MRLSQTVCKWFRAPPLSKGLQEWKDQGRFFNFRGYDIFYREDKGEGDEDPFVLLHGYPCSSHDWRKMWPGLKKRFSRLIAPDLMGMGFSAKPIRNYKLMEQTDMVEELLQNLGITKFSVITHDYSVTLGQELIARTDKRRADGTLTNSLEVKYNFFTNGGLFPETHSPIGIQRYGATKIIGTIYTYPKYYTGRAFNSVHKISGPNFKPTEEDLYDMWCTVRYNKGERIQQQLLTYMEQRRQTRERWVGAIEKTNIPMLLIYGDSDPITPASYLDLYRKLVPQSDVVVLKDTGHWLNLEKPEEMNEAIFNFIDKHKQ